MRCLSTIGVLALVVATASRSFVDAAPSGTSQDKPRPYTQAEDVNVKELENLKQTIGKTLARMKTVSSTYSNINGDEKEHSLTLDQIDVDGKVAGRVGQEINSQFDPSSNTPSSHVLTQVDIPSKGIHQTTAEEVVDGERHVVSHGGHYDKLNNAPPSSRVRTELDSTHDKSPRISSEPGHIESHIAPQTPHQDDGTQSSLSKSTLAESHLGKGTPMNEGRTATPEKRDGRDSGPLYGQNMNNNLYKYNSYSGVQYSPLDMAKYVFWTGDEKGVTLAIEEFLQEGLMTREEAISFLQDIKYNLDYLQTHYAQKWFNSEDRSKTLMQDHGNVIQKQPFTMYAKPTRKSGVTHNYDLADLWQEMRKKNDLEAFPTEPRAKDLLDLPTGKHDQTLSDEDYEELLDKLRVADFLYTEYSLEEVIYQLAKVMLSQSLAKGSVESQQALHKFTSFLEDEADQGHISKTLEKKVLDILIAALTDTLTEHPELVPVAKQGLAANGNIPSLPKENQMLRKLLEAGMTDKSVVQAVLAPYQQRNDRLSQLNKEHVRESMFANPKTPPTK